MTVLNPAGLWLLAGIPVLLVLHFLNPHRRRRVVSSVLLWRRIPDRRKPVLSLRAMVNRHLILQVAAILLITLLVADLRMEGSGDAAGTDRIIVVDTSASMAVEHDGTTRLDDAKRIAGEIVASLRGDAKVSVLELRGTPVFHGTYVAADPALGDLIDGLAGTDEAGDVVGALTRANDLLAATRAETVVEVITDGAFDLPEWFVADRTRRIHTVGTAVDNVGITAFHLTRRGSGAGMLVEVTNGGRDAVEVRLQVDIRNHGSSRTVSWWNRTLRLAQDAAERLAVDLSTTQSGISPSADTIVTARLANPDDGSPVDDGLATDNAAYGVLHRSARYPVAYVGPDNFFLLNALSAHPRLDVTRYETYNEAIDAELLVLYGLEDVPITEGRVIAVATTISGLTGSIVPQGPIDEAAWRADHPITRGLDGETVYLREAWGVPAAASGGSRGVEPLLVSDGTSYAWAHTSGFLRMINLGFHPQDSDLPLRESFPIFFDRAVAWLLSDSTARGTASYRTGQTVSIPVRPQTSIVEYPDGRRVSLTNDNLIYRFNDTARAGIYRVIDDRGTVPLAVNLVDRGETTLLPQFRSPAPAQASDGMEDHRERNETGGWSSLRTLLAVLAVLLIAADSAWWVPGRSPFPRLTTALRVVVLLLLAAVVTSPVWIGRGEETTSVILIDVSRSVPVTTQLHALDQAERWAAAAGSEHVGTLLFAGDSGEVPRSTVRTLSDLEAMRRRVVDDVEASDLAGALFHSGGLFPAGGSRRVILISDGAETRGDAASIAADLRRGGVAVSTVFAGTAQDEPDIHVNAVTLPPQVSPGDVFDLAISFDARGVHNADIAVYRGAELVGRDRIATREGAQVVRYQLTAPEAGVHLYSAQVRSALDGTPQNDTASTVLTVGRGSVLYVSHTAERPGVAALSAQGVSVRTVVPEELPTTLPQFTPFSTVILDDVGEDELSLTHMRLLERYVRETAGGLIFLGGPAAFSGDAYHGSAVEQALPVSMDVLTPVELPSVVILFVIDRSGSMDASPWLRYSKLEVVQEAVLASLEVMRPNQRIGVLSFDSDTQETVPITPVSDRVAIAEAIASLSGGGGTDLERAMRTAEELLRATDAAARHMVVLSDGLTREADFRALTQQMRETGITVSTVSIGNDADVPLLEMIAREGGGRFYHTDDPSVVPAAFAEEAQRVSRTRVSATPFFPSPRPALEAFGIGTQQLPVLGGMALTYPKPAATQLIDGPEGHPLLATHRYGLGRSVVFTSALDGGWGASWAAWHDLPRLVGQLVEWSGRTSSTLKTTVRTIEGDTFIEAVIPDTIPAQTLPAALTATLSFPQGDTGTRTMEPTGVGRYTLTLHAGERLPDVITISAPTPDSPEPVVVTIPRGATQEYRHNTAAPRRLQAIAEAGGGLAVSDRRWEELSLDAFPARKAPSARATIDLRPLLAVLAAIVLLGEIAATILTALVRNRSTAEAGAA